MKKKFIYYSSILFATAYAFAELEIKDATYKATSGFVEKEYLFDGSKKKVYVDIVALITSDDIEEALPAITGVYHSEGKEKYNFGIEITLTEAGAKKMKQITESRIRQSLAVFVDNELVSVATIMMPLEKKFKISGSYSQSEAEALAKKIITRQ